MARKSKYERLCEAVTLVCATAVLAVNCLLMSKLMSVAAQAAVEYRLNELRNETVIRLIETIEPSIEADIMLYSEREEVRAYDNTPEAETASETQIKAATDDNAVEAVQTEWAYPLTESEIRLVALIAELEDRGAMREIAEVILNRVLSDRFEGGTVSEIIYAKGQFHSVSRITDDMRPSDEAVQAVTAVFRDGVSIFYRGEKTHCATTATQI